MNNSNNSNGIGLIIALGLVALIFAVLKMAGSSFAGAFLLIAVIVLAVFLLIIILVTVFAIGIGKHDYDKRTAFSLSGEVPDEIKEAKNRLLLLHRQIRKLESAEARKKSEETYGLCKKIVDTIAKQPDEVRRSLPFFNYYLPTFGTVLEKYQTLESSGVDPEQAREKLFACLDSMDGALDKQYRNLFTNEMLDLTVETKALETIIQKDGLG